MERDQDFNKILHNVKNKASIKQKIYRNTLKSFKQFQAAANDLVKELNSENSTFDTAVEIEYKDKGAFEFQMKIGGDVILVYMHTNVHSFHRTHPMYQTSYIKEDNSRNYTGVINIYNFLSDSFKYNRVNDVGHLIGRVFINKDQHFFVEGKRQLNFLFNDFINQKIDKSKICDILEHAILYSMEFDLTVPHFKNVQRISVRELLQDSSTMRIKTSKKMGYRFSFDEE